MATLYDPHDPATVADPYPAFRRLRDEAPVYHLEAENVWVVTRHADVHTGMLDWRTFSSSRGNVIQDDPSRVGRTLTTNDPPRHDELRGLIGKVYTPRRIAELEPLIQQRIDGLILGLGDEFDFIEQFAGPLAGGVVGALIGIPQGDLDELQGVIDEAIQVTRSSGQKSLKVVFDRIMPLVQERRRAPQNDLISAFCASHQVGVEMSDEDIAVTCGSLLGAGFTSSAHMMGNILHALWLFPDVRRKILVDPGSIPAAIEEGLRWDVSTYAFGRQTTRDVKICGTHIPGDARVMFVLGSGNRDERHFEAPDEFRIDRSQQGSLAFNVGIHRCLGSSLARTEMKLAFETILPKLGEFDLNIQRATRVHSLNFRGFRSLPVRRAARLAA